jgi:hypothetical protein
MVKEVEMKPKTKMSILAVVVSLLAIELTGYLLWKRRARMSVDSASDAVADLTRAAPRHARRVPITPDSPAIVEAPVVAAFADSTPVSDPPPADAKKASLCGGAVCRPDQFCCGPPACGHCVSALRGPRCPSTCL